jgi:DNA-binding CsgD family transcriptional regulator
MDKKTIELSDPGVLEALCSDDAMRAWHQIRMSTEPLAAASIADAIQLDLGATFAALDLLEGASLVRKLPARGSRRAITFEAAVPELLVLIPRDWTKDERTKALAAAFRRRDQDVLARTRSYGEIGDREWFFEQLSTLVATKQELDELYRRMEAVRRCVIEIAGRQRDPSQQEELHALHAVHLKIAPVDGVLPPIAEIRVGTRRGLELAKDERVPPPGTLGAREVEIAKLLQEGLSRGEVAKRLGISAQTVDTYCKRLFEKLKIRRAIELNRFAFEDSVAKPARRARRRIAS